MYTLMIIDDEISTINGLKKHINWESFDIRIIATASSGNEALEKIYEYKPQIIISDIKMPEKTGLEIAAIVTKDMPGTKFLFISGYDDIELINSAFKVNAANYILKPINLASIEECIRQIVEKLKSEETEKKNSLRIETQMFYSLPLLQDNFFNKLICGGMYDKDISEHLELLNLDFDPQENFYVIIAEIDDFKKTFMFQSEANKTNSIFAILNVSGELLSGVCKAYTMRSTTDKAIFIAQADDHEVFYTALQEIQKHIMEILSISLTIGVGTRVNGIRNLSKSYVSAINAISEKMILGKKQIIIESNSRSNNSSASDSYVLIDTTPLLEALKETDKAGIDAAIKSTFSQLISTLGLPKPEQIHYINHQLMLSATNFCIDHMCFSDEIKQLKDNSLDLLGKIETLDEIKEIITKYYYVICDTYLRKKSDRFSGLIEQIQGIIKRRYFENLTINDIADEVFLTPTYICLLFKQETGMTINEYLTQTRIEISKKLIADKSNKLTDIAYLVGYADSSYFTKQFKKNTGYTPKEFRNNLAQNE